MGKKSKRKPQGAASSVSAVAFKPYPGAGPVRPGIIVIINGLSKKPELNGQIALCLEHVPTEDRPTQHRVKLINADKKGALLAVKSDNLQPADDLVSVICTSRLSRVDHCQDFADSIVTLFGDMIPTEWGKGEVPKLSKLTVSGRTLYHVSAPAAGHSFIVEFVTCRDGTVYSRILQAFKTFFTANEWTYKLNWMDLKQTKAFFENLALLKNKIDSFVVDEIIESLVIPSNSNPAEFASQLAKKFMQDSTQYGRGPLTLGLQPGKWDEVTIRDYGQERGGLTMTLPNGHGDLLLCYRIKPWVDILHLFEKLFQASMGDFFLQSTMNQGELGWTWKRVTHKAKYECMPLLEDRMRLCNIGADASVNLTGPRQFRGFGHAANAAAEALWKD